MSIFYVTRRGVVMASLAAAGVVAATAQSNTTAAAGSSPVRCEIEISQAPGSVDLQALVSSRVAASGTYRLRVSKSGGGTADIDQSGDFSITSGSEVVGAVSLGGTGTYSARLTVIANGQKIECSKRVSGVL